MTFSTLRQWHFWLALLCVSSFVHFASAQIVDPIPFDEGEWKWRSIEPKLNTQFYDVDWAQEPVVGFDSSVAVCVGDNGLILYSTDDGQTWQQRFKQVTLRSLYAVDHINNLRRQRFDYSAPNLIAVGQQGRIIERWEENDASPARTRITVVPDSLDFFDVHLRENYAIAVGQSGLIFARSYGPDADTNWRKMPFLSTGFDLRCINYYSDSLMCVSGGSGLVACSRNNGKTWLGGRAFRFDSLTRITNTIHKIIFLNDTMGVGIADSLVIRTTNRGLTWYEVKPPRQLGTRGAFYDMAYADFMASRGVFFMAGLRGRFMQNLEVDQEWKNLDYPDRGVIIRSFAVKPKNINNIIMLGTQGIIARTQDRGNTWQTISRNTLFANMRAVDMVDSTDVGYAVGTGGLVLKTTDRGESWTRLENVKGEDGFELITNLNGVRFFNADTGFIVGDEGVVMKTMDGGKNWTTFPLEFIQNGQPARLGTPLTGIHFTLVKRAVITDSTQTEDEYLGYLTGFYNTILSSATNGGSWDGSFLDQRVGETHYLGGVFPDPINGYVVGDRGGMIRTTDAGFNWQKVDLTIFQILRAVAAPPNSPSVWVFGNAGRIMYSYNRGRDWVIQSNPSKVDLFAAHAFNDSVLFAVGAEGTCLYSMNGGTEWRYAGDPITGINLAAFDTLQTITKEVNSNGETVTCRRLSVIAVGQRGTIIKGELERYCYKPVSRPARKNLSISQDMTLYPNPADEQVFLHLNLPPGAHQTEIEIVDVTGKICLSHQMSLQTKEVILVPTETLQPGVYVVHVKLADGQRGSQKLIIR
jgi:photosystem II stability/assembly factor-like uncharacterized protein